MIWAVIIGQCAFINHANESLGSRYFYKVETVLGGSHEYIDILYVLLNLLQTHNYA